MDYNLAAKGIEILTESDVGSRDQSSNLGKSLALRFMKMGARAMPVRPKGVSFDIVLPDIKGLEVCKDFHKIRDLGGISSLNVTAKIVNDEIMIGLESGTGDQLVKPFSLDEIVAKVKSAIRGVESTVSEKSAASSVSESRELIETGTIKMDTGRHEVFVSGRQIALTLTEFKLLRTLASKPGHVFSREQLLETIAGHGITLIERNVDVHIRALRKKMMSDSDNIITVRGIGYKCSG